MIVIIKSTDSSAKINQNLKDLKTKGKFEAHKWCGKINLKLTLLLFKEQWEMSGNSF